MRFAFAGIDFLGDVFHTFIDRGWEPVKLFTRPCDNVYDFNDVTVGRARQLRIPVQMARITPADLAQLRSLRCDALVVAGYPWLVRGWEPHIPFGFNFHPSPLPIGRGPYPLFQAILDGAAEWGMTAHVLAPSFDTGPIVAQNRFTLAPDETHDTLLAKCQMAGRRLAAMLAADLPRLWAGAEFQGEGSYWPRITEARRTLDFTRGVAEVLRQVRAFGSIETIARVGGKRLYVWQASGWTEDHAHAPGDVVHRHRRHIVVAAQDGFVQITGWSAVPPGPSREPDR
ncbi:MAG TPA: formyltransferase family protein [Microvirga sp.]|jgi:methionyl-tRNA formyltransferase|nr:formyltransferase family protein [Microvirga sp.]